MFVNLHSQRCVASRQYFNSIYHHVAKQSKTSFLNTDSKPEEIPVIKKKLDAPILPAESEIQENSTGTQNGHDIITNVESKSNNSIKTSVENKTNNQSNKPIQTTNGRTSDQSHKPIQNTNGRTNNQSHKPIQNTNVRTDLWKKKDLFNSGKKSTLLEKVHKF